MKTDKNHWTRHEFKAYLLLYAANADLDLQWEEKQLILSKTNGAQFYQVLDIFQKDNDYERIERIQSFRHLYFSSEKESEDLIREVLNLLNSDGTFNIYENHFYIMMKKILKS
jgi:CRISPR/Cas system endoribonuclease Cas6 (RAMP superfamily)